MKREKATCAALKWEVESSVFSKEDGKFEKAIYKLYLSFVNTKAKMSKEAKARIKINKLLEEAGWRFFDENGKCKYYFRK